MYNTESQTPTQKFPSQSTNVAIVESLVQIETIVVAQAPCSSIVKSPVQIETNVVAQALIQSGVTTRVTRKNYRTKTILNDKVKSNGAKRGRPRKAGPALTIDDQCFD